MKDTELSAAKYIVVDSRRLVSKSGLGGRCLRDGASRIWQAYGQAKFERGVPLVRRPRAQHGPLLILLPIYQTLAKSHHSLLETTQ